MAYAAVSKTVEGNLVWVRLPPPALFLCTGVEQKESFSARRQAEKEKSRTKGDFKGILLSRIL